MSERNIYLRPTTSQNLASAALSYTTSLGTNFQIMQVLFHFSGAASQTITSTLISRDGTNYNTVLDTTTTSSATDYVWRPSGGCVFMDGDELKVACTNSTTPAVTIYVTIIAEPYGKQAVGSTKTTVN
jgi:hypothetical protein